MRDSDPIDEPPLPPELDAAARAYHEPPPTPADAIWRAVQAGRPGAQAAEPSVAQPGARRYVRWGLAAAALLAVGMGLGRFSSNTAHQATVGPAATPPASNVQA